MNQDEKIRSFADKINYKLKLNPAKTKELIESGDPEYQIAGVEINEDPKFGTMYPAYEYIYGKYAPKSEDLYEVKDGDKDCFSKLDRLKLIVYILEASEKDGGAALKVLLLVSKGHIKNFYPQHDRQVAKELKETCLSFWTSPTGMPFDRLKDYFGEKFTLYFQ